MYSTSLTLLERVRQRSDQAAWDRFVRLYTLFLYHCARKLGLAEAEAADAVQDVFVLLLDKLPTFQYEAAGSFRAWLRTVTENKCRERFRRRHEVAAGGSEPGLDVVASPTALILDALQRILRNRVGNRWLLGIYLVNHPIRLRKNVCRRDA